MPATNACFQSQASKRRPFFRKRFAPKTTLARANSSPPRRLLRSLRLVKSRQSCTTASHRNCAAAGNLPARIDRSEEMPHPRPVPPAHLTNMAKARWALANRTLSGAPARDVRLKLHCPTKEGRLTLERRLRREVVCGQCTPVTVATLGAPEGDRPPKLRMKLPAVCLPESLGLQKRSSSRHIVAALRQLRDSTSAPRSLLVHELDHFDDDCLDALLAVLVRQPRIFALNIGEATRNLSESALEGLVRHLQSSHGARIACLYLGDTTTPKWALAAALAATGSVQRKATEAQARAILADGKSSRKALQSARKLVPWRDPHVWAELDKAPLPSTGANVKWGMPTWHPKSSWPALA